MIFRILAALLLCFVVAVPADAGQVRHPQNASPAFTFTMPDDWNTRITQNGGMTVMSADRNTAFSLSMVNHRGTLDELATRALEVAKADPPQPGAAIKLSGYPGRVYYSTMTNASGIRMTLRMIAVRIDATRVAACTLLTRIGAPPASAAIAERVFNSLAIAP